MVVGGVRDGGNSKGGVRGVSNMVGMYLQWSVWQNFVDMKYTEMGKKLEKTTRARRRLIVTWWISPAMMSPRITKWLNQN